MASVFLLALLGCGHPTPVCGKAVSLASAEAELGMDAEAVAAGLEALHAIAWGPWAGSVTLEVAVGEPRASDYAECETTWVEYRSSVIRYGAEGSLTVEGLFEATHFGDVVVDERGVSMALDGMMIGMEPETVDALIEANGGDPEEWENFRMEMTGDSAGGDLTLYGHVDEDALDLLSGAWTPLEE